MKRFTPMLLVALVNIADESPAQPRVETRGITARVKLEEVISGHLGELNGKFKFRVTELTFEPGGYLGEHHHAGPGIRFVAAGKLTFVQAGKVTTYEAGNSFYESGNVVHTAHNKTKSPVESYLSRCCLRNGQARRQFLQKHTDRSAAGPNSSGTSG